MIIKTKKFAVQAAILILAVMSLAPPGAAEPAPDPADIMVRVQEKYDQGGSFKTWFHQETRQAAAAQGEKASGVMFFQKPSRMRWQYENPPDQKKEVISDGRQVWIYIPEDALAMVYPLNQVLRSDLVLRFFSGIGAVPRDFHLFWQRPPAAGPNYVIRLEPRQPQAELKRLILTINPLTYLVENLEFSNALGEETRFAFSRTTLGVKLAPSFFTFIPPPGVQVIREAPGAR
jgi:outer membrane lipoprotein carrier protein